MITRTEWARLIIYLGYELALAQAKVLYERRTGRVVTQYQYYTLHTRKNPPVNP